MRATAWSRLRYCGPNRRMSIFQVSKPGSPSRIHSAITRPTPPAPAMPWAQNPAATKNPATSLSPSTNSLSGVNPSGPLTSWTMSACSATGTRWQASVMSGAKRSQSSGSRRLLKSSGTPSTDHGAGSRS